MITTRRINEERIQMEQLVNNLFGRAGTAKRRRGSKEFPGFSTERERSGMRVRFTGLNMWLKSKPNPPVVSRADVQLLHIYPSSYLLKVDHIIYQIHTQSRQCAGN